MPSTIITGPHGKPFPVDWKQHDLLRNAVLEIWDTLDARWPVGSALFTVEDTNPAAMIGVGTWEESSPHSHAGLYVWKRTS